jgi:hypothetical protein
VQLITNQIQPKVVPCGSAPLSFQVFATVKSNQNVVPETYHWVRPDGTATAPATLNLEADGASSTSTLFTPATDTFSGAETLVFTSPVQGSWSLQLSMTCSLATAPLAATASQGDASQVTPDRPGRPGR